MSVQVQGITKTYGKQRAVNGITFTARQGDIMGFLGPNGAGKSTTMKIITGYLQQTEGTATVCGLNTLEHPLAVRKKIGYLPEHNPLYLDMYVHEYLRFTGSLHHLSGLKQQVKEVVKQPHWGPL